jgi:hypothetical protein
MIIKKTALLFTLLFAVLFLLGGCGEETPTTEDNATTTDSIDTRTGCSLEYIPICGEDGLTYQNSCFSSLRDVGVQHIGVCEYTVCSFNGQDHYVMDNMLYYEDNLTRPYINVLYGTFILQSDGDGWTYVRAINKESSYYTNRMREYDASVTESGNDISCNTVTEMPEHLKEFLKMHGKILELKIQSYKEQEANASAEQNISNAE